MYEEIFGEQVSVNDPYIEDRRKRWKVYTDTFRYLARYSDVSDTLFPIIMNVQSKMMGLDLVSVQPMSMPKGNVFYLDYRYDKIKWYEKLWRNIPKWIFKIGIEQVDMTPIGVLSGRWEITHTYKVFGISVWRKTKRYIS